MLLILPQEIHKYGHNILMQKNLPYIMYESPLIFFVDIFKTARPLGDFVAILLTYVASSVLHVSDCACWLLCYSYCSCFSPSLTVLGLFYFGFSAYKFTDNRRH